MSVQTILDSSVSAAATGSWFTTNYKFNADAMLTVYSSVNATAAGDFKIELSPDQNIAVSVALPTGTSYTNLTGNFPYVRAVKAANTLGGKVVLVEKST